MWGAKSGKEQLAPFPEPTHAAGFPCGVPNAATNCVVRFQSNDAFKKAYKMVLIDTDLLCLQCCTCRHGDANPLTRYLCYNDSPCAHALTFRELRVAHSGVLT